MNDHGQDYLRDVQYRFPDRLKARSVLHTRYGRGDWFDWLARHIPLSRGAAVADVGCGAGSFWVNAPQTITADLSLRLFDLSPGMVDAARAALATQGRWSDVQVTVADAVDLPLPDASISTVIAVHMLYHLADPVVGLREMARITYPGGTVAVVLNPADTMGELAALTRLVALNDAERSQEPLSSEQGLDLMRPLFSRVDVVRYDDTLRVSDPVDLLAYLCSLPIADRPGAADELAIAVDAAFKASNGIVTVTKAAELLLGRV